MYREFDPPDVAVACPLKAPLSAMNDILSLREFFIGWQDDLEVCLNISHSLAEPYQRFEAPHPCSRV
jgi:hypothetical protein